MTSKGHCDLQYLDLHMLISSISLEDVFTPIWRSKNCRHGVDHVTGKGL